MATAAVSRRPFRKPKPEHLCMVYPKLPDTCHKSFWLAAYLQDLAKHAAIKELAANFNSHKGQKTDHVTHLAAHTAANLLLEKLRDTAKYTKEDGMLLYAWPGTTFFDAAAQHQ